MTADDFILHVERAIGEARGLWPLTHPEVGTQAKQDRCIAAWVLTRLREQQRISEARERDMKPGNAKGAK